MADLLPCLMIYCRHSKVEAFCVNEYRRLVKLYTLRTRRYHKLWYDYPLACTKYYKDERRSLCGLSANSFDDDGLPWYALRMRQVDQTFDSRFQSYHQTINVKISAYHTGRASHARWVGQIYQKARIFFTSLSVTITPEPLVIQYII